MPCVSALRRCIIKVENVWARWGIMVRIVQTQGDCEHLQGQFNINKEVGEVLDPKLRIEFMQYLVQNLQGKVTWFLVCVWLVVGICVCCLIMGQHILLCQRFV